MGLEPESPPALYGYYTLFFKTVFLLLLITTPFCLFYCCMVPLLQSLSRRDWAQDNNSWDGRMPSITDYTTQWEHSFLFAYQRQFCRVTSVSHWQHMIISLTVASIEACLSFHYTYLLQHLPPFTHLSLQTIPPHLSMFSWRLAHHHGTLSRADCIIDILCTDALAFLIHSSHRSGRDLPGCPLRALLLLRGGVYTTGDGAITGAGRQPRCSFTPGSLGWLEMKERWKGSSAGDSKWIDAVNWMSGS